MNQTEFIKYLKTHEGPAWIGNPETLESARALEGRGIVQQVGEFEGKPYYRFSRKGEETLGLAVKPVGIQAKNFGIITGLDSK